MYQVTYTGSFKRDTKRYKKDKAIKALFETAVKEICNNPETGTQYTSNLFPYYKFPIGEKPQYRVIYTLYECLDYCNDKKACKYEDVVLAKDCKGLIEFHFFRTREECTNLYNLEADYFQAKLRE